MLTPSPDASNRAAGKSPAHTPVVEAKRSLVFPMLCSGAGHPDNSNSPAGSGGPVRDLPRFTDKYSLEAAVTIGDGFNGRVVRAVHRETGALVAVKVLADHAQSRLEVECQRRGKTGAVRILDVFTNESASEWKTRLGALPPLTLGSVIVVVMELMDGGELYYRVVNSQGKRLSEADARVVAVQLAETLAELHAEGVVHRDLKPENILLRSADSLDLKLCDFGFASLGNPDGIECTVVYAAPEMIQKILSGTAYAGPAVSTAYDCWSLGVVLYLCLAGRYPFRTRNNEISPTFRKANLRGSVSFVDPVWDTVSNAAKSVVLGLLTVDPSTRMSAAEVLAHPWLRDLAAERARERAAANIAAMARTSTSDTGEKDREQVVVSPVPRIEDWPEEPTREDRGREDSGRPDSRDPMHGDAVSNGSVTDDVVLVS